MNMHDFDPHSYGPAVAAALADAPLNELGPGTPRQSMHAALSALTPEQLVAPHKLVDREMALACLAALWLRQDFLDESHRISQELENPTGSYWHGIMHRREGDFGNSKYWFRRVGNHPLFEPLAAAAQSLASAAGDKQALDLVAARSWDPYRFVDLCQQAVAEQSPLAALCRRIQQREWELLFDDCYRHAVGEA